MKKHKLKARLECSNQLLKNCGEQNTLLTNVNIALRRELADLRTGCNGAIERNVQLVAEFKALEKAHEAQMSEADCKNCARAAASDAVAMEAVECNDQLYALIKSLRLQLDTMHDLVSDMVAEMLEKT